MAAAAWLLLALLGHAALCVTAVNRSHGLIANRLVSKSITALCALALIAVPVYAVAAWPVFDGSGRVGWLAWYANACVAFAVVWLVGRVALVADPWRDRKSAVDAETIDLADRLGDAATGSPTIRKAAALPANQLLRLRVERREFALPRLPEELDGLRIAHLTDLHMSPRLGRAYFDEIVRLANEHEPDLVCLTGDIVEHPPQLDWVGPVLGALRPTIGAYFVLGNHDALVDSDDLRRRLEAAGFADAGRERFAHGAERGGLVICGDERPWFPNASEPHADDPFTIALLHTPDRFGWAASRGVDLALAGHTHGGQVCFPLLGPLLCPSRHGVRYVSGTFRRGRTAMHVSRGTGSLFPLRYACPPELGLFTLRRGGDVAE